MLYEANVTVAKRIAEAVARHSGVKRFIHVSAVGADPMSPSTFMQTKWLGEQEVKKAYPNVTIMRPCHLVSPEDNFVTRIGKMHTIFGGVAIIDHGAELR